MLFRSSMPGIMQNESFKKVINVNWLRYSYTLPVTSKDRAAVQVVYKNGVSIILMLFFYLPVIALYCHIAETEFLGIYVIIYLLAYASMMLVGIFSNCFILSARSEDEYKKQGSRYCLTSLVVLINSNTTLRFGRIRLIAFLRLSSLPGRLSI